MASSVAPLLCPHLALHAHPFLPTQPGKGTMRRVCRSRECLSCTPGVLSGGGGLGGGAAGRSSRHLGARSLRGTHLPHPRHAWVHLFLPSER